MAHQPTASPETPCGNPECGKPCRLTYCNDTCKNRSRFLREFERWKDKEEKPCRRCETVKPIGDFRNPGVPYCQECMKVKRRKQYESQGGKEYVHEASLARRYDMSLDEYRRRVAAQEGRCAICRERPEGKRDRLYVDHDHATGAVRDLLCRSCNHALGNAKDDIARLEAMIDYLRRHTRSCNFTS